ncbi:MAG: biotin/lipoyl-binding protein, partial [Bacilli bacterium]
MSDIKKKKSNKIFYIVIALLIIVVILALVLKPNNAQTYNTIKVANGNINITVSGTGALKASDSRKEYSKVSTTVDEIYYKEGDAVKIGDIIAQLNNEDYLVTVKSQEIALKQAQNNIASIEKQISNLSIIANQTGYIDDLTIDDNSYVSTSMNISNILMDNNYEIVLQFIYNAKNKINVGDKASICLIESFKYLPGIVT